MEKKKKSNDEERIISLPIKNHGPANDKLYTALSSFVEHAVTASADAYNLLNGMRETAMDAVTSAGLRFSTFRLDDESATYFGRWMMPLLFGDEVVSYKGIDSELREHLQNNDYPVLIWKHVSKNANKYEVNVFVEENPNDPEGNITLAGQLIKKDRDGLAWQYDFNMHYWTALNEYEDGNDEDDENNLFLKYCHRYICDNIDDIADLVDDHIAADEKKIKADLMREIKGYLNPVPTHYELNTKEPDAVLEKKGTISLNQTLSEFLEKEYTGKRSGGTYYTYGDLLSEHAYDMSSNYVIDGINEAIKAKYGRKPSADEWHGLWDLFDQNFPETDEICACSQAENFSDFNWIICDYLDLKSAKLSDISENVQS